MKRTRPKHDRETEICGCPRCAAPVPAPTDAWPNRPQCGRPGHDPACLCSTGWVRQPEPEPSVKLGAGRVRGEWHWSIRPAGSTWSDPPAAFFAPTTSEPDRGRARAIAAWRARR